MTTTEIDLRPQAQPSPMATKIAYAKALAESGLLPAAYRKNPANVLWAMEYGEMLGLAPMATMIGVHVIDGKPTASAGLISGLVRQAGHKLRVWGDGDSATCEIIRSDEPKHVFSVTWTLRKTGPNPSAEEAKLLSKSVWQQYPASMLKSRAITQCSRDACDEVLFGLHYTPEELGAEVDEDGVVVDDTPRGRGTLVIDPECLVENEQSRLAERSGGTPDDDLWYGPAPEDARPWADQAIADATAARSVNAAWKIRNQAGEKAHAGQITWDDARKIKELAEARIHDIRQDTFDKAMRLLSQDEPWREKIDELTCGDDAERVLAELEPMPDKKRQQRISHAIIAKAELGQWNLSDTDTEDAA